MALILKAFGYTALIFFLAIYFMIIVLILTRSAGLAALTFPASIFLGILAFLTWNALVRSRCSICGALVLSDFLNIHQFLYM